MKIRLKSKVLFACAIVTLFSLSACTSQETDLPKDNVTEDTQDTTDSTKNDKKDETVDENSEISDETAVESTDSNDLADNKIDEPIIEDIETETKKQDDTQETDNTVMDISIYYNSILDDISRYYFDDIYEESDVTYKYSLLKIAEEEVPLLLVNRDGGKGMSTVRIFQYDKATKSVIAPDDVLSVGGSAAGGYRADLSFDKKQSQLQFFSFYTGNGESNLSNVRISDGKLITDTIWEGLIDAFSETEYGKNKNEDIIWINIEDRKALKASSSKDENVVATNIDSLIKEMKEKGLIVLKGTIQQFNEVELLKFMRREDSSPGYDEKDIYTVFILSAPQELTVDSVDGLSTREASMISLDNFYDSTVKMGEEIIVCFDREKTAWPSDASLPYGAPSTSWWKILR